MKKYHILFLAAIGTALLLTGCSRQQASAVITSEEAQTVALDHAGLDSEQVHFLRTQLEMDDGRQVYEVEFYSENAEYDYTIDAQTGAVLEMDKDIARDKIPPAHSDTPAPAGSVTPEEAQAAALSHAGLTADDVHFVRTQLETDDGRQVYEVEFYSGSTEYDYTIDAQTGVILEADQDIENYGIPSSQVPSTGISEEEAKAAALSHAGLSTDAVSFIRASLEWEDGLQIFEVIFFTETTEYNYSVDAQTGAVLESEMDAHG